MKFMEGNTRSAGTPFSTLMFLNCSSASLGAAGDGGGLDCAFAPAIARHVPSANPQRTNTVLPRSRFIPSSLIQNFPKKSVSETGLWLRAWKSQAAQWQFRQKDRRVWRER